MLPLKGDRSEHLAQSSTELEDLAMDLKADLLNLKAIFYSVYQLLLWGAKSTFETIPVKVHGM